MLRQLPLVGSPSLKDWNSHGQYVGVKAPNNGTGRLSQFEFTLAWLAVFTSSMNFLRHPAVYITLSDILIFLCLLTMLVRRSLPLRPLGAFTSMWMIGSLLLLCMLMLSSLFVGDAIRGIVVSMQYLYTLILLPFVLIGRPAHETVSLCKALAISIVLMCLFGIYLVDIDGTTNTQFVSGSGRMMSFVERENECASLIALTIPIVIWLRTTRNISLIAATVALAAMVYGVLLTGSNTGLFAVLMSYCLFVLANFSIWYALFGSAALATTYYFVVSWGQTFLPAVFQKRVLPAIQSGDLELAGTLSDRMLLFYESLDIAQQTSLLGIGADQYRVHSFFDQVVHNTYMLIWTEGGLPALVGLVMTLLTGICISVVAFRNKQNRPAALCALSCILVFALAINAAPHIYARFWFAPLFLALALSLGRANTSNTGYSMGNQRPAQRGMSANNNI